MDFETTTRTQRLFLVRIGAFVELLFLRLKCRILHSGHWHRGPNYVCLRCDNFRDRKKLRIVNFA
jgi:hypothetical protein